MEANLTLAEFLSAWSRACREGLGSAARQSTLRLQVVAEADGQGGWRLRPARVGEEHREGASVHEATVVIGAEVALPAASAVPVTRAASLAASKPGPSAPEETGSSSADAQTLRRRLELVLGGPPGFTTGAKAEVLSDLLQEFGRPALLEEIRRSWISQFDTGPEASDAVRGG